MTEEHKYLDQLFQSKFAAFEAEPPAAVWQNIHKKLHNNGGGSINPVTFATIAALIMISGLLSFSIIKNTPGHLATPAEGTSMLLADNFSAPLPPANMRIIPSGNSETPAVTEIETPNSSEGHFTEKVTTVGDAHNSMHIMQQETVFAPAFERNAYLQKLKSRKALPAIPVENMNGKEYIPVRNSQYQPVFNDRDQKDRAYVSTAQWQFGLLFSPQVTFYPNDAINNQRGYGIDFSARWKKKEFFIESGIGLAFSSDNGNYSIDYEKYLGTYNDVYNVTFDTLPDGTLKPNYHTNPVDVYDTIGKYRIEQTKNRYTYLQVPVLLGFQKQFERFGWFVKTGPVISVMLSSDIPTPDTGDDRIIGIDQQMPGRVNTHWQLAFSAGFTYQLSDRVSLAVEPTFRYYLNSQYNSNYINTRHPYSLGLRTGLLFNF